MSKRVYGAALKLSSYRCVYDALVAATTHVWDYQPATEAVAP